MKDHWIALAALVSLVAGFILTWFSMSCNADEYKAACEKQRGTAVYNGKYWECMK